jgi:hypothetical protein
MAKKSPHMPRFNVQWATILNALTREEKLALSKLRAHLYELASRLNNDVGHHHENCDGSTRLPQTTAIDAHELLQIMTTEFPIISVEEEDMPPAAAAVIGSVQLLDATGSRDLKRVTRRVRELLRNVNYREADSGLPQLRLPIDLLAQVVLAILGDEDALPDVRDSRPKGKPND